MPISAGIHHITAFVNDVQTTVDFYAGVMGLRLVKRTVNYDAPDMYHLYFGNESGTPGTIMTFFPHEDAYLGTIGGGQVGITVYAIPRGSLLFWKARLQHYNIQTMENLRFGEQYIRFADPSGLLVDLVERESGEPSAWAFSGITAEQAIKGFGGAMLFSTAPEQTQRTLEKVIGLRQLGEEEGIIRFRTAASPVQTIDLVAAPIPAVETGAGTVHHLAWRAKNAEEQRLWREELIAAGLRPTPVTDRQYFTAVYFREPGGILFEIATDGPGFAVDEPAALLGTSLKLPEEWEQEREQIVQKLPSFEVRSLEGY
ncbi:glyoxalase family protein [Paenibacillus shirakamiensis]|uniref:Glyoxalase family protein n=1 Tax=Paenibacillus shirakamiensis TaxID=1265935 RepID=A0ABS4JGQ0_9BACL|nr:VOC family protein [Paenibacillus shirakamiensis]MBP2000878.1 glyoxalase family protein [Paenibacillus shirakamiensis]